MTNTDLFILVCSLINKYEDRLTFSQTGKDEHAFRQLKGLIKLSGIPVRLEYSSPSPAVVSLRTSSIKIVCYLTAPSVFKFTKEDTKSAIRSPLNIEKSFQYKTSYLLSPQNNVSVEYKNKDRAEEHLLLLTLALS